MPSHETDPPPQSRVPDVAASLIRTWVPIGVGTLLALLAARLRIVIDARDTAMVGMGAVAAVSAAYYALARLLEASRRPALRAVGGFLLGGVVRVPVYVTRAEEQLRARVGRHRA